MSREDPRRPSLGRELGNNLQIGLATGLIGGGLLGFLGAAAALALNPGLLGSFGNVLHLVLGLQLVYALLCLALGLAGAALKTAWYLLTGRSISDTKTSAFVAWLVFFLIGALYSSSWVRWQQIAGLAPGVPVTWRQAPVLLAVLVVSAVLAGLVAYAFYLIIIHVKKPERRRPGDLRRAFLILLYMAGAFVVFLGVARVTAGSREPATGLTRDLIRPGCRVLVLAVDGLDAEDVARARRQGRMAWAAALEGGARGVVPAARAPLPPMDWTLAATGQDLASHGITDYQTRAVRGLPVPVAIGPDQLGLFELAQNVLPFLRLTRTVPVKSWMRETKALWNIASDAGRRSVVVNWWVSWPAERVRGAVVSDHAWMKLAGEEPEPAGDDPEGDARVAARVAASVQTSGHGLEGASSPLRPDGRPLLLERETWPATLLIELAAFAGPSLAESLAARYGPLPSPEALALFDALGIPRDALRSDCFYAQAAAWLFDREAPDLAMLYLPGPDVIRRVLAKSPRPAAEREAARQRALAAYWEALEGPLAAIVARADSAASPQAPVLLFLTQPGLPWEEGPARGNGIFSLSGPGTMATEARETLPLADVAPTVLWMLGLPVARDMSGGPHLLLAPEEAARLSPVRFIPTYGRQQTEGLEQAASSLDQEMLERFRSLGYIQ